MDDSPLRADSFAENPEPRLPCVLILDVSRSMAVKRIAQLNDRLNSYKQELCKVSLASRRVEVAVLTFGTEVSLEHGFALPGDFSPPTLKAAGWTFMVQAVDTARKVLQSRKQEYRSNGLSFFLRPWLLLISDGGPNDPSWQRAARSAVAAELAREFKMFCIGVENANFAKLGKFCLGEPVRLKDLRFHELFLWLSSSQHSVSRSSPGEAVTLEDPTSDGGWAARI